MARRSRSSAAPVGRIVAAGAALTVFGASVTAMGLEQRASATRAAPPAPVPPTREHVVWLEVVHHPAPTSSATTTPSMGATPSRTTPTRSATGPAPSATPVAPAPAPVAAPAPAPASAPAPAPTTSTRAS